MNDLKDEVSEISESSYRKPSEDSDPLDRQSALNAPGVKKKGFGYLGLILMGLAALALLLLGGKDKPADGLQKEALEFEPAPQRQIIVPESPPIPAPLNTGPSEEELERLKKEEAMRQARMKSAIVVYGGGHSSSAGAPPSSQPGGPGSASSDPDTRFQQEVGNTAVQRVRASSLGSLDQVILQGKMIDAVMETAISSDLPGMVRAIVSREVYAEAGNRVLIPQGSRLLGQYNAQVTKGQSRVYIVWTRVIRPDGIEVALNSGGTDNLGRAGMGGSVNHHFWQIFGTSTLLSIIGAGAANAGVSPSDQFNSEAAYRQEIAQGFQNTASNVLSGYINIPPTIRVKQGSLIKVFVARDLDFSEAGDVNPNFVMIE